MRGLRYILNIDHSYYSHITNEEVIDRMNLAINEAEALNITWTQFKVMKETQHEEFKTTKLVGDIILDRQETLLGHVLRLPQSDIMRQVTCNENLRRPYQHYKRTGAPRLNWYDDNMNRVYAKHGDGDGDFDFTNQRHVDLMKKAATDRKF